MLQGKANKSLLKTENDERQPAGKYIVQSTNGNGHVQLRFYEQFGYPNEPGVDYRRRDERNT